jgi:hypothetical protein
MTGAFFAHFTKTHLDQAHYQPRMPSEFFSAAQPSDAGTCPLQGAAKRRKIIEIVGGEPDVILHDDTDAANGLLAIEGQNVGGFGKAVVLVDNMIPRMLKPALFFHEYLVTKAINRSLGGCRLRNFQSERHKLASFQNDIGSAL